MELSTFDGCAGSLGGRWGFDQCRIGAFVSQRWGNQSAINVATKLARSFQKNVLVDGCFRSQFKIDHSVITDFTRPEIVGDEIQRWDLVPWGIDPVLYLFGLESVHFQLDFAGTIKGDWKGNRRVSDGLPVDGDERPFRVASH